MLGLGLINFNLTIDLLVATHASSHAVSDLNFAFRLFMLPQGLFSVAVSQVLFPEISRLAARRDIAGFARTVANGSRAIIFLLLPAAAVSIALATPIVRAALPARPLHRRGHHARQLDAGRVLDRPGVQRAGAAADEGVLQPSRSRASRRSWPAPIWC